MKVSELICLLTELPQNAPVVLLDQKRHADGPDDENILGLYTGFFVQPIYLVEKLSKEEVKGIALAFDNDNNTDDLVSQLMESKILHNRVALALTVHPDNEDNSEFADLIDSCEEMSSEISSLIEP